MVKTRSSRDTMVKFFRHALLFLSFTAVFIQSLSLTIRQQKLLIHTKAKSVQQITRSSHGTSSSSKQSVTTPWYFKPIFQEYSHEIAMITLRHRMMANRKTATSSFHSTQRVTYLRKQRSAISET